MLTVPKTALLVLLSISVIGCSHGRHGKRGLLSKCFGGGCDCHSEDTGHHCGAASCDGSGCGCSKPSRKGSDCGCSDYSVPGMCGCQSADRAAPSCGAPNCAAPSCAAPTACGAPNNCSVPAGCFAPTNCGGNVYDSSSLPRCTGCGQVVWSQAVPGGCGIPAGCGTAPSCGVEHHFQDSPACNGKVLTAPPAAPQEEADAAKSDVYYMPTGQQRAVQTSYSTPAYVPPAQTYAAPVQTYVAPPQRLVTPQTLTVPAGLY